MPVQQRAHRASDQQPTTLESYLTELAAATLRVPAAQLNLNKPLTHMGLDSLMAIEIRNRLKTDRQVDVPVVKFLEGVSITELARELTQAADESRAVTQTGNSTVSAGSAAMTPEMARQLLTRMDQLSDEEVDALLAASPGMGESSGGQLEKGPAR